MELFDNTTQLTMKSSNVVTLTTYLIVGANAIPFKKEFDFSGVHPYSHERIFKKIIKKYHCDERLLIY